MTNRGINSVDHELCAVTVVFPHEITKHVGARALVPCRMNLIMNANFVIARHCYIVKDRPQRLQAPKQVKYTFHIHKKSANNHTEVEFKQTKVPPLCICGTCSPGRVGVIGHPNDRATSIVNRPSSFKWMRQRSDSCCVVVRAQTPLCSATRRSPAAVSAVYLPLHDHHGLRADCSQF